MAYDSERGEMVLFGGATWVWDGSNWTEKSPEHTPPPLYYAMMAYDPDNQEVVLFGGNPGLYNETTYLNETWVWDGNDWTERHPANSPPARILTDMAYDSVTGEIVMYGGQSPGSGGALNDTWSWDGTNWTELHPSTSPGPLVGAAIASDPRTGGLLMFGGANGTELSKTWTWDGTDWTEESPEHIPPTRHSASMDFDPKLNRMVLFGGRGFVLTLNDTWVWDGTDWTEKTPLNRPVERASAAMAFDPNTEEILLFGGARFQGTGIFTWKDTWAYSTINDQPPTASITDPIYEGPYTIGSYVPTGFSCHDSGGPGIASCEDSNGDSSPGHLDTTSLGVHTYTVTATSIGGSQGADSISYTVVPEDPPGPPCSSTSPSLKVAGFGRKRPSRSRKLVMGVRVRLRTNESAVARLSPELKYRIGGRMKVAKLDTRTEPINFDRKIRFPIPGKVRRDFQKAGRRLLNARVTFAVKARLRDADSTNECFGPVVRNSFQTRLTRFNRTAAAD